MICQRVESSHPIGILPKRPLVHDPSITSIIEKGWGYPWLRGQLLCEGSDHTARPTHFEH